VTGDAGRRAVAPVCKSSRDVAARQVDPTHFQSCNPGIINVCLMDGSGRAINSSISQKSWNCALDPADGQVFDSTW
jgi:hypothetical protein